MNLGSMFFDEIGLNSFNTAWLNNEKVIRG